jgi:hypothetical protein
MVHPRGRMIRKTRKHSTTEVHTIPQLRRLFEHIEQFVDTSISNRVSKESLSKDLRKEWKRTFIKELDKKSADAFIEHRMKKNGSKSVLRTTRKHKGGSAPLAGAPLEYTTRQGIYLAPNSIPQDGQLPLSKEISSTIGGATLGGATLGGATLGGGFGSYVNHVHNGFWNPMDAQSYDPIKEQQAWPVPYESTGSNLVGGKRGRKLKRSQQGGSALLTQAFQRPFTSDAPPSIVQDMESSWYGQEMGPSPAQVERQVTEVRATYTPPSY